VDARDNGVPADFVGGVPVPRMTVSLLRREMAQLDHINHIVVLMLENRSFGSMLGMLYPASARFDGLICSDNRDHLSCRDREQP
jgi:hypothetical protein